MNIKIGIISLWVSLFFMACYEDKGNYDYLDYNEIKTISSVSALTKTSINLGDTVRIVPKFTWKYPDQDTSANAFEFVWIKTWGGDTLSRERELEYIPTECCSQQSHYLFITDKATGIVYRQDYSVTVKTPYLNGFLVASNVDNQGTLHYFRRDSYKDEEKKTHYYWTPELDVYRRLHSEDPLGKLENFSVYSCTTSDDEVVVFQEDGEAYVLNGLDFKRYLNLEDDFTGGYPAGFKPKQFVRGGYIDVLLGTNGQIYWRSNSVNSTLLHDEPFMDTPVYFAGGGANVTHFFDKWVGHGDLFLGYDALNKRLISMYGSFSSGNSYLGMAQEWFYYGSTPGHVSPLDYGDAELIYLGVYNKGNGYTSIIKKDGQYLLQDFVLKGGYSNYTVTINSQEVFVAASVLSDKSVFFRGNQSLYLYFTDGANKLYYYNTASKEWGLYGEFPGNITFMEMDPEDALLGLTTDAGTFHICSVNDIEILVAPNPREVGEKYSVTGLGDIIGITWKFGGYYNETFWRY